MNRIIVAKVIAGIAVLILMAHFIDLGLALALLFAAILIGTPNTITTE